MLAKLRAKLGKDGEAAAAADAAAAVAADTKQQQPRYGPTGAVLPPSDRPLVSYLGSPYGVAPDFVLAHRADVAAPLRLAALPARIAALSAPIGQFGPIAFDGFDQEFKYLELREAERPLLDVAYAALEANTVKNRYANILPPEHTRVRLAARGVEFDDYVNANYVDGGCAPRRYIASQGPLPHTFADFWRLVWEQRIGVVLMLTREIESGVIKCARYWPEPSAGDDDDDDDDDDDKKEAAIESGDDAANGAPAGRKKPQMSDQEFVSFDGLDTGLESAMYGDVEVAFLGKRLGDEFTVRLFHLQHKTEPDAKPRQLVMLQYTGWPDHGVPASPAGFVTLTRLADRANRATKKSPLLVHCSAGVGRTGTFMMIHSILEELKQNGAEHEFSVVETLYKMRGQRPNSVQTKDQYRFCYLSIQEQGTKLLAEQEAKKKSSKSSKHEKKEKTRTAVDAAIADATGAADGKADGEAKTSSDAAAIAEVGERDAKRRRHSHGRGRSGGHGRGRSGRSRHRSSRAADGGDEGEAAADGDKSPRRGHRHRRGHSRGGPSRHRHRSSKSGTSSRRKK